MALADRLYQARKEAGLSQKELAERIGVRSTSISDWERGRAEPSAHRIAALLGVLHIDLTFLYQDLIEDVPALEDEDRVLIWKIRDLNDRDRMLIDRLVSTMHAAGHPESELGKGFEARRGRQSGIVKKELFLSNQAEPLKSCLENKTRLARISLPANDLTRNADFVFQQTGEAMAPEINDRDLLLVSRQNYIEDGEIGLFQQGERLYVRLKKDGYLHAMHPEYGDIPLSEQVVCYGKVLGTVEPAASKR